MVYICCSPGMSIPTLPDTVQDIVFARAIGIEEVVAGLEIVYLISSR